MGRFKENKVIKRVETKSFLTKWGLKYNELIMCKPSYDIFVDDKHLVFENGKILQNFNLRKF